MGNTVAGFFKKMTCCFRHMDNVEEGGSKNESANNTGNLLGRKVRRVNGNNGEIQMERSPLLKESEIFCIGDSEDSYASRSSEENSALSWGLSSVENSEFSL